MTGISDFCPKRMGNTAGTPCHCCRADADAERGTEGAGRDAAMLANYDDSVPMYSATVPAYTASMGNGGWGHHGYDHDDHDGGFFAPPPQADGYGNFDEPAALSLTEDAQNSKGKDKKGKKDKSGKKEKPQDPLSEIPVQELRGGQHDPHHHDPHHPPAGAEGTGAVGSAATDQSKVRGTDSMVVNVHSIEDPKSIDTPKTPEPPKEDDPHDKDKVYGHPGMTLQIYLDTGWSEYGDDEMKQINGHLKDGSTKFAITTRGAMYMIDFSDLNNITQMNPCTRKSRDLRIVKIGTKGGAAPKKKKDDSQDASGGDAPADKTGKKSCCCVIS